MKGAEGKWVRPSTWRVAHSVGWVTFREVIRDKVLYNIILIAFLIFSVGFLASRLSFVTPERIILDFGLSAVNISSAMIAVFTGSGLLGREFASRTIYVALSHPISRAQFTLGKFFGLSLVLLGNWLLLSLAYLVLLGAATDKFGESYSIALVIGLGLVLVQSLLLASISIFFSTFSTTSLAVIMSVGVYLVGNNISQIRLVAGRLKSSVGAGALNTAATLLPNLEFFNLGFKVTYGLPITWQFVAASLGYGFCLIALFLTLAGILIRAREV